MDYFVLLSGTRFLTGCRLPPRPNRQLTAFIYYRYKRSRGGGEGKGRQGGTTETETKKEERERESAFALSIIVVVVVVDGLRSPDKNRWGTVRGDDTAR